MAIEPKEFGNPSEIKTIPILRRKTSIENVEKNVISNDISKISVQTGEQAKQNYLRPPRLTTKPATPTTYSFRNAELSTESLFITPNGDKILARYLIKGIKNLAPEEKDECVRLMKEILNKLDASTLE